MVASRIDIDDDEFMHERSRMQPNISSNVFFVTL